MIFFSRFPFTLLILKVYIRQNNEGKISPMKLLTFKKNPQLRMATKSVPCNM